MVNESRYFNELQKIIGDTKPANEINERWNEALKRLEGLAAEYANELQAEKCILYQKFGVLRKDIWQLPPYRLLTMNLILSYWIGWLSIPKSLHLASGRSSIQDAYHKSKSNNVLKEIANPKEGENTKTQETS
jgi:hypothetical protein